MSLFCSGRGSGLQHFLQTPKDSEVAEGGRAVLACQVPLSPPHARPHHLHHHHIVHQVGDRVGSVQWTRDGLTLGYDRDLPGFDRYSVLGTDEAGTYNLQVSSSGFKGYHKLSRNETLRMKANDCGLKIKTFKHKCCDASKKHFACSYLLAHQVMVGCSVNMVGRCQTRHWWTLQSLSAKWGRDGGTLQ